MKIYQLIYTKVPKGKSPWGKVDFHTVFYPISLINKNRLFELESRIYFPGGEFIDKKTVFYFKIENEQFLVILYIKNLPEARDSFGRGGLFLCHGFLFPEELWKKFSNPLILYDIIKDYLFNNIDDVLSSEFVNFENGNIEPLEIPEESIIEISDKLPELNSDFEFDLAILLNRVSNLRENTPSIVLKGEVSKVSNFLNKIFAYVPDVQKINLAFDPAFDGGNLHFNPIKIVGYSKTPPTGSNYLEIDLDNSSIKKTDEMSNLFSPSTPYERWLKFCRSELKTKEQIERAYKLSIVIEKDISYPTSELLPLSNCFAEENKELILQKFETKIKHLLGPDIIYYLLKVYPPISILDLVIQNIPLNKIAECVEDIVIKKGIKINSPKTFISDNVINIGGYKLKLLNKLWSKGNLELKEINILSKDEKVEMINYLILTGWFNKEWFREILIDDEQIFNTIISKTETKDLIVNFIRENIIKDKRINEIADIILKQILSQKKIYQYLKGELDYLTLIKESLYNTNYSSKNLMILLRWLKRINDPRKDEILKLINVLQKSDLSLNRNNKEGIFQIILMRIKNLLKGEE